jgi:hypothetical protein
LDCCKCEEHDTPPVSGSAAEERDTELVTEDEIGGVKEDVEP